MSRHRKPKPLENFATGADGVYLEVIAAKHNSHNVFADVMNISLHCSHDDDARIALLIPSLFLFLLLNERDEVSHGLLHHSCRFNDLHSIACFGSYKYSYSLSQGIYVTSLLCKVVVDWQVGCELNVDKGGDGCLC